MGLGNLRRKLVMLTAFAMPVVLLKVTAAVVTGGGGPRHAAAYVPPAPAESTPLLSLMDRRPATISEQERRTAQYIARLRGMPFGRNPLFYEPRTPSGAPRTFEPAPAPLPVVDDRLDARVQAILASRDGANEGGAGSHIALIDGRPYRAGDLFPGSSAEGRWHIVAIDSASRTVMFRHIETGEEQTRTVTTSLR